MKTKILIAILAVIILLGILFVPIPKDPYDDGGTREYVALTYKIVAWNKLTGDETYQATKVYWGKERSQTVDQLWELELPNVRHSFLAQVIENDGSNVVVQPLEGEEELRSSKLIRFGLQGLENILGTKTGQYVKITYTGGIMETYPAQINVVGWELTEDLRTVPYTGQFLDMETAKPGSNHLFTDIVITRIYSNCFFAHCVVPMPYQIKLNCSLSDQWCVGDQVAVTYENIWFEEDSGRLEADLLSIDVSTFQLQEGVCYKPVIYLYPQKVTDVSVKLFLDGELTCTYPAYQNGWQVTADPAGTLTDSNGQTYNYLYWEGTTNAQWDRDKGFCIKGEDTAAFLEDALARLGLSRKEANEFIVFWLPLMQDNPYNIISFQTDAYTDAAELQVSPTPDTVIRVFMTWQASEEYRDIEHQLLTAPDREGFTVVEWGGTEIK